MCGRRWNRRSRAFWMRSASSRWTRCSNWPTTWKRCRKGEKLNTALVNKLSHAHHRNSVAARRADRQRKERAWASATGPTSISSRAQAEPAVRGREGRRRCGEGEGHPRPALAPLLRDTLLAFNYAHYAPPGAQILYTNPTVRAQPRFPRDAGHHSHLARHRDCTAPAGPRTRGGRLVGSLSTLPYALAEAEQNFLIPAQTQALIWGDLVPQMILSAKIPRWWNVTPAQVHWVGLHMRYGRELMAEAALDPELRKQVVDTLWLYAAPARTSAGGAPPGTGRRERRCRPGHAVGAVLDRAGSGAPRTRRTAPACWPS